MEQFIHYDKSIPSLFEIAGLCVHVCIYIMYHVYTVYSVSVVSVLVRKCIVPNHFFNASTLVVKDTHYKM